MKTHRSNNLNFYISYMIFKMDSKISPGDLRNNRLKQRGSKATFHKLSLNGELVMAQSKSTIGLGTRLSL